MSSAATTRPDRFFAARHAVAAAVLFVLWGPELFRPLKTIPAVLTGLLDSLSQKTGAGVTVSTLLVLLLSFVVGLLGLRLTRGNLPTGALLIGAVFAGDVVSLLKGNQHPLLLLPDFFWLLLATLFLVFGLGRATGWINALVLASLPVFWLYDSVVELAWRMGWLSVFPVRPEQSFTFRLDGFLGQPGIVFVALPALLALLLIAMAGLGGESDA